MKIRLVINARGKLVEDSRISIQVDGKIVGHMWLSEAAKVPCTISLSSWVKHESMA